MAKTTRTKHKRDERKLDSWQALTRDREGNLESCVRAMRHRRGETGEGGA